MLDRKQYDLDIDKANKEQIEEITKYLTKYIELNANMREQKISTLNNEQALQTLLNTNIPAKGRDFKEVATRL